MKEDEECQSSQEEFKDLKAKFIDLSERYNSLQEEVHAQTKKTNQLVQKINHSALIQKNATPDPTMNTNGVVNKNGVVAPPVDQQYDGTPQMRHPLVYENRNEKDDIMHYYNNDKKPTPQNYLNE